MNSRKKQGIKNNQPFNYKPRSNKDNKGEKNHLNTNQIIHHQIPEDKQKTNKRARRRSVAGGLARCPLGWPSEGRPERDEATGSQSSRPVIVGGPVGSGVTPAPTPPGRPYNDFSLSLFPFRFYGSL